MNRLSIILPIYNVEKYLPTCIESILGQDFVDYELILVDDGSKDSSSSICDDYSDRYDNIKVVHKKNGGLSDARNVGLSHASGNYVFFIDSDDFLIDNHVLSKINDKLQSNPDVIAFKSIKWYDETGKFGDDCDDLSVQNNSVPAYEKYLELIDKDTYYNSAWSKVIRRAILIENNITFEKGLLGEDNDWYYKVISHIETLELINEPLYVYRQRQGSITKSYKEKNLDDLLWIIEKWTNYIGDKNITGNNLVIRNSLAKQYCHAIIGYASLANPKRFLSRLKKYNYLLQYSNNPRVLVFRKLNKYLGLRGIIYLLKFRKLIKK